MCVSEWVCVCLCVCVCVCVCAFRMWSGVEKIVSNYLNCCVLMTHKQIMYQSHTIGAVVLCKCLSKLIICRTLLLIPLRMTYFFTRKNSCISHLLFSTRLLSTDEHTSYTTLRLRHAANASFRRSYQTFCTLHAVGQISLLAIDSLHFTGLSITQTIR